MNYKTACLATTIFMTLMATSSASHAAAEAPAGIRQTVDAVVRPIMTKNRIAGMAVGVVADGKPYVFNYGVASRATGKPVTGDTLFELGSVSKTLTATLVSYAQVSGRLSLSDKTSQYLPALQGHPFGEIPLLDLGTHTPGGLPLQVPDGIHDNTQLMQYLKAWRPSHAPGTYRTYSNISIGTLGLIAARRFGQDFITQMQQRLLPALGMTHTYIDLPQDKMADYAQGYTKADTPIRMAPGVLAAEAYGIKSTAADMLRFVQANMAMVPLEGELQRAISATHTGYFKAGPMTQDLIWEQYPYPVSLQTLLDGNSATMILHGTPVTPITPPQAPRADAWINKTGSTNGFGAYIAFIPQRRLGIVILANKNFPMDERVSAAYRILTALADGAP
ncbi:class C beta-lactamase [Pandoraea sp.]|uniref:class C beta-lactamase n=1 Tax=Pandoraea sp. TaxID=1883445 RepID=UPI0012134AEC|nr:class C beta-lactamase [Pandoraea sp.]TAL54596.1 MAG: beta-lactamase [Pandoraea sp.]TAM17622.1 MAG: beta-lactamase [Pandoraea sp.]